jgi:5'(3')-deoxyribonucleotidase
MGDMGEIKVAVDLDEVLSNFLHKLTEYYNAHYRVDLTPIAMTDYTHSGPYHETWQTTPEECKSVMDHFYETDEFKSLDPIPGARAALYRLKLTGHFTFYVVTARGTQLVEETKRWIRTHFTVGDQCLFEDIIFGNCWANQEGTVKQKHTICKELQCTILVDDSLRHADACARNGIHVVLFNFNQTYEWCNRFLKTEPHHHEAITEKINWIEVEAFLRSKVFT